MYGARYSVSKSLTEEIDKEKKIISESNGSIIFKDEQEFKKSLAEFEKEIKSPLVSVKVTESEFEIGGYASATFHIFFDIKDKYINNKPYEKGEAVIYPSKDLYSDIDKTAKKIFGIQKVTWNNTQTIGWFRVRL